MGYWWSGLKFEKNCVPPQDVNSHNLGFVYLEASELICTAKCEIIFLFCGVSNKFSDLIRLGTAAM